ncbi:hypothetical protein NE237_014234 [Protea cynaroides]|uniref:Uncharacterized protein n=1 Tax=Protea cynaroides TaxID=273540 RepID=A0A9Q0JR48_9MAGN|nr:hypothetical protein NE237_014234 [Protea cynaroides]
MKLLLNGTLGKVKERRFHLGKLGKSEREQSGGYRERKGESRRRISNQIKSAEMDPKGASAEKVSKMLISWGATISVLDDKDAFMTLGLLFNLISLTRSSYRLVGRGTKSSYLETILEKLLKLQRNGFLFTLEFVIDEFFQPPVFNIMNFCYI